MPSNYVLRHLLKHERWHAKTEGILRSRHRITENRLGLKRYVLCYRWYGGRRGGSCWSCHGRWKMIHCVESDPGIGCSLCRTPLNKTINHVVRELISFSEGINLARLFCLFDTIRYLDHQIRI